jgi:CheY-like chemotaxis protein
MTLRVLLAEDEPTQRRAVARLLAAAGVAVVAVDDGAAAVERGLAEPFDVVLMDCQMPRMDGIEAARQLRAGGVTTPICALTASPERRRECLAAGMDAFLDKPLTTRAWASLVTTLGLG